MVPALVAAALPSGVAGRGFVVGSGVVDEDRAVAVIWAGSASSWGSE